LQQEDHILAEQCRKGDQNAQRQLYEQYKGTLFGVCLRYAKDREEAKDLLQESFIQIYKDLYQYRPTGALGAWMRTVTVRVALQHLRKNRKLFATVELGQVSEPEDTAEDLFSRFRAQALLQLVQRLPDGYRAVFNLYAIEGYSHKEIAEQLSISEATSKSQLSRAKASLRQMLEQVV
jgi:RNA polymerase sigma factor (sigma-70 family)